MTLLHRYLAAVALTVLSTAHLLAGPPVRSRVLAHDIPGTLNNQAISFTLPADSSLLQVCIDVRASIPHEREPIGESRRSWGVIFGDTLGVHYRVALRRGNSDNAGFSNTSYLRLSVDEYARDGARPVRLVDERVSHGISNSPDGANTLQLSYDTDAGTATLQLGASTVAPVATFRVEQDVDAARWSVYSDAWLDVESAVSRLSYSSLGDYLTSWTREALDAHFDGVSSHPLQGYWRYLDIESGDDDLARAGGFYTIAIVGADDGNYDILYVDGASVNAPYWQPYMKRGRLIDTRFVNHYDLQWTDASFHPMSREASASLDAENGILTLSFPLYRTTLRFTRR